MVRVNAAQAIRSARFRAGLTLREFAAQAGTSHSAIAAYESGAKSPSASTVDRIVRAAGFSLDRVLSPRVRGDSRLDKGAELAAALELAAEFPARHSAKLEFPVFGR